MEEEKIKLTSKNYKKYTARSLFGIDKKKKLKVENVEEHKI